MKLAALVLVVLVATFSPTSARESDYCHSYDQDPYLMMGTKTAYQFVRGRSRLPPVPSCTPVQIWILSRHGTRYPGSKSITQLVTLPKLRDQIVYNHDNRGNGRLCDADLQLLKNWRLNANLSEVMANSLTTQGKEDMKLLARRLQSDFSELLRVDPQNINDRNYKFRAAKSERTESSMDAFMEGLFNSPNAVPADRSPDNDTLLQDYKNCPTWQKSKDNDIVNAEAERFIAGMDYQNLLQNVSRRLGFAYKINNDSVQLMYDMCRYEKAWDVDRLSAWCSIFSKDELKTLEYLEDLRYYYQSGPGRDINAKLGCPLLQDMFYHFKNLERGSYGNEPQGIFYFSHTVTLQTLMAALGIGKDPTPLLADNYHSMGRRSFRTSYLGSFSSNLIAVYYRCSDARSPNKVMFYMNEAPINLDGCSVGLCDWEYLKARFGRTADQCSLNFCYNPNVASGLVYSPGAVYLLLAGLTVLRSLLAL